MPSFDTDKILSVKDLNLSISTSDSDLPIIKDASFDLKKGSTLGIIGESGSGKSMLCRSLIRLNPARSRLSGTLNLFKNGAVQLDLLTLSEAELRAIRGKEIGFLSQEPGSSMNPVIKCGKQIFEALPDSERENRSTGSKRVLSLLRESGLKDPESIANSYPHELSGGMLQRVALAAAIAGNPKILIADEPVTALDASTRLGIMKSLSALKERCNLSLILVSHDIEFVSNWVDDIMVMYLGSVVELGKADKILSSPSHPYTEALLDVSRSYSSGEKPITIPGDIPSMESVIHGCRFHPRCRYADDICSSSEPPSEKADHGGTLRCFHPVDKLINL